MSKTECFHTTITKTKTEVTKDELLAILADTKTVLKQAITALS